MVIRKQIFILAAMAIGYGSLSAQSVPDASLFLPGPPEQTSIEYIKDYLQYAWGKSLRATDRGRQAEEDFSAQISRYLDAYSKIVGITLSSTATPNINALFEYCMEFGNLTMTTAQNAFPFFRRPYAELSEETLIPLYEKVYENVSSYPSREAMMGWLYALVLTEICPDKQDEVLARGYEFGNSSVISGYHWDSDVMAGRLLASALLAKLHNHSGVNAMFSASKAEYEKLSGISIVTPDYSEEFQQYFENDQLPNAVNYLPTPPDTVSAIFACDMNKYIEGRMEWTPFVTSEGETAISDVTHSVDYFATIYSPAFGRTISATDTPELYELMTRIFHLGNGATKICKAYYKRPRPFEQMNKATAYPPSEDGERGTGSYPSGHASSGWLNALLLAEINPSAEEGLLARAYQYGQSRVITSYHWQSDVDYGRIVGAAVYARLHTSTKFLEQLEKAKAEFNGSSDVSGIKADDGASTINVYTLGGVLLNGEPTRNGVYIKDSKKVVYQQK